MITPTDARGRGKSFSIAENDFYIGLFDFHDQVNFPGFAYAALLLKVDSGWETIDSRQAIWKDTQENFTPEELAPFIINDFNKTLLNYGEGGEMTYIQTLAAIFQTRLELVEGQLVINPKEA